MTTALQEALAYIHSFKNFELSAPDTIPDGAWDLARIERLLARLGDPQNAYPIIHIAGSKGKGSTAAFCSQALMAAGLRTGLYISPHLVDFRERIQINRALISPEALLALVQDVKPHAAQVPDLTWFEMLTALAFLHYARERVDVAVVEVGLGGRLDATNVVRPVVSVITRLGLDHTQLLGDTLAKIAAEKAAIIKPGVPVVSGPQDDEAAAVIEEVAARQGSPLARLMPESGGLAAQDAWTFTHRFGRDGQTILHLRHGGETQHYTLGLRGAFQAENAAVAAAALHHARKAGLPVTEAHLRRGFETVRWRGRLEFLSYAPLLVVDSAHNPQSAAVLADELGLLAGGRVWTLVFGCMSDKDVDGMLDALLPVTNQVILTQANHPRATPPDTLLARIEARQPALKRAACGTVAEALKLALEESGARDRICVAGSLAVAGEAIAAWEQLNVRDGTLRQS